MPLDSVNRTLREVYHGLSTLNSHRYESNSGGEREIQRTMLELLNQLDGFDSKGDVKVMYAMKGSKDSVIDHR